MYTIKFWQYFVKCFWVGVCDLSVLVLPRPIIGLLYQPLLMVHCIWCIGGMIIDGKTVWKTWPSTTLSFTSPTWTDLGSDLGICREKPAINCLSYAMACIQFLMCQDYKTCNVMFYSRPVVRNCELSGKYGDIVSSDSWPNPAFRVFCMMAGSAELTSFAVCHQSWSKLFHCIAVNVRLWLNIFMLEMFSFGLQTWVILSKYAYCTMRFCWNKDMTSQMLCFRSP